MRRLNLPLTKLPRSTKDRAWGFVAPDVTGMAYTIDEIDEALEELNGDRAFDEHEMIDKLTEDKRQ